MLKGSLRLTEYGNMIHCSHFCCLPGSKGYTKNKAYTFFETLSTSPGAKQRWFLDLKYLILLVVVYRQICLTSILKNKQLKHSSRNQLKKTVFLFVHDTLLLSRARSWYSHGLTSLIPEGTGTTGRIGQVQTPCFRWPSLLW